MAVGHFVQFFVAPMYGSGIEYDAVFLSAAAAQVNIRLKSYCVISMSYIKAKKYHLKRDFKNNPLQ